MINWFGNEMILILGGANDDGSKHTDTHTHKIHFGNSVKWNSFFNFKIFFYYTILSWKIYEKNKLIFFAITPHKWYPVFFLFSINIRNFFLFQKKNWNGNGNFMSPSSLSYRLIDYSIKVYFIVINNTKQNKKKSFMTWIKFKWK